MENNNENLEIILTNKIKQFGNYLIENCKNENTKQLIKDRLCNLKLYEILLFATFLQKDKLDEEVNLLINKFEINDCENVKNEIKTYVEYFIKIIQILNKK